MEVNHAIIKMQIDLATFCQLLLCLKKRGDRNFIVYDFNKPNFYTWNATPNFSELSVPRKDQALKIFQNSLVGICMTWSNSIKSQH